MHEKLASEYVNLSTKACTHSHHSLFCILYVGTFPDGMQMRKQLFSHTHTLTGARGALHRHWRATGGDFNIIKAQVAVLHHWIYMFAQQWAQYLTLPCFLYESDVYLLMMEDLLQNIALIWN